MLCGANANSSIHQPASVYIIQMCMPVHAPDHAGDAIHTPATSFSVFLIQLCICKKAHQCTDQREEAEDSVPANVNIHSL